MPPLVLHVLCGTRVLSSPRVVLFRLDNELLFHPLLARITLLHVMFCAKPILDSILTIYLFSTFIDASGKLERTVRTARTLSALRCRRERRVANLDRSRPKRA